MRKEKEKKEEELDRKTTSLRDLVNQISSMTAEEFYNSLTPQLKEKMIKQFGKYDEEITVETEAEIRNENEENEEDEEDYGESDFSNAIPLFGIKNLTI